MKTTLLPILLLLFASTSFAQVQPQRNIALKNFGSDSLHIPLNAQYYLIEDSCAQIVRQAHINMQQRFFYGKFKDVSSVNPDFVVTEGFYNNNGQKEGTFTTYHLNGQLLASGNFKEDKLDGEWKIFYASGNPKLTFKATEGDIIIENAWDENGNKVVADGTGKYQVKLSFLNWTGKLENGKPVGTWRATAPYDRSNTAQATERFKDGKLVKGTSPIGVYSGDSRITWFNMQELPFINAEKLAISSTPCNGTARKKIIGAQYRHGATAYSEEIKRLVGDYLSTVNLKSYDDVLKIEAEIAESGRLVDFMYTNAFDDKIAMGLTRALGKLPLLEPALADGKPIRQKFAITFKFNSGVYYFNYSFLPISLAL